MYIFVITKMNREKKKDTVSDGSILRANYAG